MNTLLEAEHLTKVFAQRGKEPFKAVDDVSFSLQAGETLGIVGESGSGKSTLAKMITRLTDITDGTLKFQGKDITKLKQSQLRDVYGNIQMVFQNPAGSFDPRRTLGDGIGESLRNRGMKKTDIAIRVKELLEQCGLDGELAKRYPHEVSVIAGKASIVIDYGVHSADQSGSRGKLVQKLHDLVFVWHGKVEATDSASFQSHDSSFQIFLVYIEAKISVIKIKKMECFIVHKW